MTGQADSSGLPDAATGRQRAGPGAGALGRAAVGAYRRLEALRPHSKSGRVLLATAAIAFIFLPSIALLYLSLESGRGATRSWFEELGYSGVFLANLASTATLFLPVPGLTATAQALIASSAKTLDPFLVGLLGGLGMSAGEITAYVAGMAGAEIARDEHLSVPRPVRPLAERALHAVETLMRRHGMATLFTLSLLPNFLFEFAGLSAGATRYAFWKFGLAVSAGKVGRALVIAYLGRRLLFG